jgi:hypothetical protein
MKTTMTKYMNISIFVTFAFFAAVIYNGTTHAGDYSMGTNLNSMAELLSKWSKQLGSGKVEPKTQEKMGEMMSRMSQVLQEMTGSGSGGMHMDHHQKIEAMEKEWDPFDTSDKM